jgi:hypothetical protein
VAREPVPPSLNRSHSTLRKSFRILEGIDLGSHRLRPARNLVLLSSFRRSPS